jgi:hypothetical protein
MKHLTVGDDHDDRVACDRNQRYGASSVSTTAWPKSQSITGVPHRTALDAFSGAAAVAKLATAN